MTVKEQLITARAKIEAGWCKGTFAKDKNGNSLGFWSEEINWDAAVCYCTSGALRSIGCGQDSAAYKAMLSVLRLGVLSIWNDASTKEEVLAGFDKTIAAQA
jgi:hypothetical protein